jgi:tRNA nucleotidyltransferase/poly(A) polymerase
MERRFLLVGGAVRDSLLGKEPKDKDYLAVGYTKDELLSMGFENVGKDFPIFLHPETKEEYALPRTEISTGSGYGDFKFNTKNVSIEEDLKRRDLTINAMAWDEEKGVLIDPFGGKSDLENKILRHTSEAFKDDPLRVLRVARFQARFPDFTIHQDTLKLMKELVDDGKLNHLTSERVTMEMLKALKEENAHLFFLTLDKVGALEILFTFTSLFYFKTGVLEMRRHKEELENEMDRFASLVRFALVRKVSSMSFSQAMKSDIVKSIKENFKGLDNLYIRHSVINALLRHHFIFSDTDPDFFIKLFDKVFNNVQKDELTSSLKSFTKKKQKMFLDSFDAFKNVKMDKDEVKNLDVEEIKKKLYKKRFLAISKILTTNYS